MDTLDTPPKVKHKKAGSHKDYRKKYYALRKVVKELVFVRIYFVVCLLFLFSIT